MVQGLFQQPARDPDATVAILQAAASRASKDPGVQLQIKSPGQSSPDWLMDLPTRHGGVRVRAVKMDPELREWYLPYLEAMR